MNAKIPTPIKAIRLRCLDCCCHQRCEVRLCPSRDCSLWPYRLGRRPQTAHATVPLSGSEKGGAA